MKGLSSISHHTSNLSMGRSGSFLLLDSYFIETKYEILIMIFASSCFQTLSKRLYIFFGASSRETSVSYAVCMCPRGAVAGHGSRSESDTPHFTSYWERSAFLFNTKYSLLRVYLQYHGNVNRVRMRSVQGGQSGVRQVATSGCRARGRPISLYRS